MKVYVCVCGGGMVCGVVEDVDAEECLYLQYAMGAGSVIMVIGVKVIVIMALSFFLTLISYISLRLTFYAKHRGETN